MTEYTANIRTRRLLGSISFTHETAEELSGKLRDGLPLQLPQIQGCSQTFSQLVQLIVDQLRQKECEGLLAFWERNGRLGVCIYESSFWKPAPDACEAFDWLPDLERTSESLDLASIDLEVRYGDGGGCRLGIWAELESSFEENIEIPCDSFSPKDDLAWALEGMALRSPLLTIEEAKHAREFRGLDLAGALVPILDNLPLSIAVYDETGKARYMNGAARTLFGAESGGARIDCDELVSRTLFTNEAYSPSGTEGVMQVKIRKEDRFFRPYATPIVTQSGENAGVLVALSDISDMQLANDLKGDFVGSVSHEIKGPLTSIRMAIMLLLDDCIGKLNTQQLDLAETAKEEVERLLRTLHNFLDVQRLQGGSYQLDRTRVDARELLDTCVSEMKRVAKPRGVTLSVKEDETLDISVMVDKDRIVHVLNIFVSNAIKHSEDGMEVVLSAEKIGDSKLRFTVSDKGTGIDPRYHQQIFNSYVRTPGEVTGGMGLGLSLARDYIQAHGGQLGVESALGEGSRFYFDVDRMS